MTQDVYAIYLTGSDENRAMAADVIAGLWDDVRPLGDRAFLVADDESSTSGEVRDKLLAAATGHDDAPPLFLVVPVEYYAGYNSKSLWEWLSKRIGP